MTVYRLLHVDNGMPFPLSIPVKLFVHSFEFGVQKYPTSPFTGLFFCLPNKGNVNDECIIHVLLFSSNTKFVGIYIF